MLSDRYFIVFGIQLKFAFYLMGTPFKWNASERRLYVTKFSHARYTLVIFGLVGYALFLIVQLYRYNRMGLTNNFYYYFLYVLMICAVFDTIAGYPFFRYPKLGAAFMTELYRFLDEMQSKK